MESPHDVTSIQSDLISEDAPPPIFPSTLPKNAVLECTNIWIYYLQMLNGLCTAGFKLSQCLTGLSQLTGGKSMLIASQCQTSWEELLKSTLVATQTVKKHIVTSLQDISIADTHSEEDSHHQIENNHQIISENVLTFINLQYQFSIANCEFFGTMATCPCCQTLSGGVHDPDCEMATLQQCFARLCTQEPRSQTSSPHSGPTHLESPIRPHSPTVPMIDARIPSPFVGHELLRGPSPQGFLETMRGPSHFETLRGPFPNPGQLQTMKAPFPGSGRGSRSPLNFPLFPLNGQRRWSEAAAAEMMGESSDGTMRRWSMPWDSGKPGQNWSTKLLPMSKLAVPVATTSQDRSRSATPETSCIPSIAGSEGLAEAIQLLSSRPIRTTMVPSHPCHPLEDRLSRKMYHLHGGHRAPMTHHDSQESSNTSSQQYDINPPIYPQGYSRKSSSSTDSSSCLSIHSRSTTSSDRGSEGMAGDSMRSHHMFSIWSGIDYLPFIRVPESQEPQDSSSEETESTDGSRQSLYPKPT